MPYEYLTVYFEGERPIGLGVPDLIAKDPHPHTQYMRDCPVDVINPANLTHLSDEEVWLMRYTQICPRQNVAETERVRQEQNRLTMSREQRHNENVKAILAQRSLVPLAQNPVGCSGASAVLHAPMCQPLGAQHGASSVPSTFEQSAAPSGANPMRLIPITGISRRSILFTTPRAIPLESM